MTYANLKHLTKALLIGDNVLTKDPDELLVLLDYALDRLVNEVDVLHLYADSTSRNIVRQGMGAMVLKKPELPSSDSDELDIDHELGFVVARFIASFVSREKMQYHEAEAQRLSRLYNQKVQVAMENLEQYGDLAEHDETDQFGKRIYPGATV